MNRSQASLEKNKADLEARRQALVEEIARIDQEMFDVDDRLSQIPTSIAKLEQDKKSFVRQDRRLQKNIKPIPGSANDDQREIGEADVIRLRVIDVIQNLLGSV